MLKICKKCGVSKDYTEFSNHTRTLDKKSSYCKACHLKIGKEWRLKYNKDPYFKFKRSIYQSQYRERYPEKVKAQLLANRLVTKNDCCEECSSTSYLHLHHPDYSQPLYTITLCRKCHANKHKTKGVKV